jgi:hypothetical protein
MFRFGITVLTIWVIVSGFVGTALYYGRSGTNSAKLQALGIDLCKGKPCFRALNAIFTGQYTANPAVLQAKSIRENGEVPIMLTLDGIDTDVVYQYGTIDIMPQSPVSSLTAAHIIDLFGTPCNWGWPYHTQNIDLYYPQVIISAQTIEGRLDMNSPITRIKWPIASKFQTLCLRLNRWLGFTSLLHYIKSLG